MAQTNWVISELKKVNSDCEYEIKPITTKGDTDTRPLFTIDQKGGLGERREEGGPHENQSVVGLFP